MGKPKKVVCSECKKEIWGYNKKHALFLLEQHKLTHKKKKEEVKNGKWNNNRNCK